MYKLFIKRLIDFVLSLLGFIMLFPVFMIVTVLLFIANGGKPFFFQPRPGKNEVIFKVIKFKTMNDNTGADGELLSDSDRLTKVGEFVRKTSLDEIPQLLNVIKGEMSLIGPRPLLVEYLPLYSKEQSMRHTIRPGITGWAQINGRNAIGWQEKFSLDIWYVNNLSFLQDVKIIFMTIFKVFKSEGISSDTSQTMEKFRGN